MAGMRLVAIDGLCLDVPAIAGNARSSATRATTLAGAVPAGPRRRPGRVRDPGDPGGGAVAAGHRGAAAGPQAAAQAQPGRPAAGRPELLVPRPADRCAGRGRARAVAREKQHRPPGPGSPARRHVPVADRGPGCRQADAPQGRGPPGHPRHRGARHRVLGDQRDGTQISETFTLVTDITDPAALSAEQAAGAYARRWSWRPASMNWRPPSAAGLPWSCGPSPRR